MTKHKENLTRIIALLFLVFGLSQINFEKSLALENNSGYNSNIYINKKNNNITNINKKENIKNINNKSNNKRENVLTKSSRSTKRTNFIPKNFENNVFDVMWAIRMHESGGNYKSRSKWSSASGAYQFIDSTWNNFGGYERAYLAPARVQDERMFKSLRVRFDQYGDWEKVIASHFYPAWANDKSKWNQSPGGNNPTIWEFVNDVRDRLGW